MKWRRIAAWIGLAVVGVALLAWAAFLHGPAVEEAEEPEVEPEVVVRLAEATARPSSLRIRLEGRVEPLPERESRISPPIEGQVRRVAVREGDRVTAGQVLIEMHNADLAGMVTAASGALDEARAAEERARQAVGLRGVTESTTVTQAEAALGQAESKLALLRNGARPQEIEQARASLREEEAKLAALQSGSRADVVSGARHAVEAERADLDRLRSGSRTQDISAAGAALAVEEADLARLEAGARPEERAEAEARLESARIGFDAAEAERKRKERLSAEGVVSRAEAQSAAASAATARADYESARQQLAIARNGAREEEVRAQKARRDKAAAELDALRAGSRPEEIAEQEARLHAAEAALRDTQAGPRPEEIDGQRAVVERARTALELITAPPRVEDVGQAEAEVRDARAALDLARAGHFETSAVRSDVSAAAGRRRAAEGSLRTASATLAKTVIRSPIGGTVSRVLVNGGEMASPGTPVIELLDLQAVRVRARVSVGDLALVSVGQQVELHVDGLPDRAFRAGVAVVSPEVDPETHTGEVALWLPNEDGALKEGMFATGSLEVEGLHAVVVPTTAVVSSEAELVVYVAEPDDEGAGLFARRTPIEAGRVEDDEAEVLRGLSGGERVVTEGAYGLPDGAAIVERGEDPSDASP